jgi:hypothetical protein
MKSHVTVENVNLLTLKGQQTGVTAWLLTDENGEPSLHARKDQALGLAVSAREREQATKRNSN